MCSFIEDEKMAVNWIFTNLCSNVAVPPIQACCSLK